MTHITHNYPLPGACSPKPRSRVAILLLSVSLILWSASLTAQERQEISPALLAAPGTTHTMRAAPTDLGQFVTDDPRQVLEQAYAWQQDGKTVPEALLKQAVAAALRPDASWTRAEAAMQYFDLYKDRPWVKAVITPFAAQHARQLLLNADFMATVHRDWARQALAVAALQAPAWALSALPQLMAVDPAWARQLVAMVASTEPTLALAHAEGLLAVDRAWARGILQRAARGAPQKAVSMIKAYVMEPWGPQLFADAALAVPRWAVTVAASQRPESQTALETLQRSQDSHLRLLAQIAQSGHPDAVAARMGGFVYDIVAQRMSLEEATRLSMNDQAYYRALVARKLAGHAPQPAVVDDALHDEATILFQYMNELFDKPDTLRFRPLEPLTARELYAVLAYGEDNAISTSYHGAFTRFLSRMRQEKLTGEQLLVQVNEVRIRPFIKAAAKFNRLEAFLATLSSPAARVAVLIRCFSGIDRTPDLTVQAALAAEILDTPLDDSSLDALRGTIVGEYRRIARGKDQQAMAIYGLLAARLALHTAGPPPTPEFTALVSRYQAYLPDWQRIPFARLFDKGLNVQRYFFYNDEDGQGSFRSFLAQYRSYQNWHIEDQQAFVRITASALGRRIVIYANKPTDEGERTQSIDHLIQQEGVTPQVIVHRGHSPYVVETIVRMPVTTALVFLGNCGGYTLLEGVFNRAPEAHVITTIGVGTLTINDPFLRELNEYLLQNMEGRWADFWQRAAARLQHNPRFADYVTPDHNAGALFLKAYRDATDDPRAERTRGMLMSVQR